MDHKKQTKETTYFRDSLTTVDSQGKRKWVYAKKPKGAYFSRRRVLAAFLLFIFYVGPFIRINGEPIMLFNIMERKFIIFGVIFWPQDFHLILLTFITLLVFIVLFTVIFGRLFCGWVCPQTIFMEFVFRRIEYLIEGDYSAQKRLDRQNWNTEKITKKTLKHAIFFLIALVTAFTFLAYVIGVDALFDYFREGLMAHLGGFTGLVLFAGAFYFVFAFFREQVCTIACPYGRLQSVLIDKKSIIVGYDYKRGEPRMPLSKNRDANSGDCIDCNKCVIVCPTGIDIRNGTQMECINCTACMDACNSTMDKVNKPRGLIRYDSEEGIATGTHKVFNPRSIAYSVVLTLLIFFVAGLFVIRGDFEATILRARGSLFQEYGADSISNIYNFNIVNKIRKPINIDFKLESHQGNVKYLGENLVVNKGEVGKGSFLVIISKDQLNSSSTPIIIGLYRNNEKVEEYKSTFVGPNALDNP
ncbi:MAG: cytochrome c oxidase accessory protein CcoG [Bacteroidales bacterium]|jgi:cytochrome c oxidase accessory protein FixG|nr:cytochrome c oxidase accessory protein CcoG [Bacteroidales bacterium]